MLCESTTYDCDKTYNCGCGYSNVNITRRKRIISGEEAVPHSWPMIVVLTYIEVYDGDAYSSVCGGTILTDSYILTAASCVRSLRAIDSFSNLTVSAGVHNRSDSHPIKRNVDQIIMHPNFRNIELGYENDIALVHLSTPLDFSMSRLITRTCLPPKVNTSEDLINHPAGDSALVVIGWGRTLYTYDESDTLQQLTVYVMDRDSSECANLINSSNMQFCATSSRFSLCFGDFGGPILQWTDNHWIQVGISSFTDGGCETSMFGVYTRVAYYNDWIESIIYDNENIENDALASITTTSISTFQSILMNKAFSHKQSALSIGIACIVMIAIGK